MKTKEKSNNQINNNNQTRDEVDKKIEKGDVRKYAKIAIIEVIVLICILLVSSITWVYKNFNSCTIESILFQISQPLDGTDSSIVLNGVKWIFIPSIIGLIVFNIFYFLPLKKLSKEKYRKDLVLIVVVVLLLYFIQKTNIIKFIIYQINESYIIDENYVDPNLADITFPENKRNLIYIVLESMENSYASKAKNGCMDKSLIPEIVNLMEKNVNFSNNSEGIGGFKNCSGTGWTVASLVSQSTGLPLKIKGIGGNDYGNYKNFMPGVTSLRRNS